MRRTYIVCGSSRSGLVPVAMWLARLARSSTLIYNDFTHSPRDHAMMHDRSAPHTQPDTLVVVIRDEPDFAVNPVPILRRLGKAHRDFVGSQQIFVPVVRDYRNWLASGMYGNPELRIEPEDIRTWRSTARLAMMGFPSQLSVEVVPLLYDRWVTSESYRRDTAHICCLEHTDAGIDVIPCGSQSSFTGYEYQGRALEQPLTQRYKQMTGNGEYAVMARRMDGDMTQLLSNPPTYDERKPMRLLMSRWFNGMGDWIMVMSVIKHLNVQYPKLQVDVLISNAPPGYTELLAYWDIVAAPVVTCNVDDYDYFTSHMIYEQPAYINTHLISSMINVMNVRTGLSVKYDPKLLATYLGPKARVILPKAPYAVMVSEAKKHPGDIKSWTYAEMDELSVLVAAQLEVVQVDMPGSDKLGGASMQHTRLSLLELCSVVQQAHVVIAFENGLSHMAGHLGTNCVTLYRDTAPGQYKHCGYPKQIPITIHVSALTCTTAHEVWEQIPKAILKTDKVAIAAEFEEVL